MSTPAPEKVFPAGPAAASPAAGSGGSSGGSVGVGRVRVDKKTAAWAGAGVVVLLGLLAARSSASSDPDPEGADFELDTTETDLYNELQPELENIGDQLDELNDRRPRPRRPKPHRGNGGPRPPKPGPRPGKGPRPTGGVNRTYRVANGDTLRSIARDMKVRGGAARLYVINRRHIERAARQAGHRSSQGGRILVPGTVIFVP